MNTHHTLELPQFTQNAARTRTALYSGATSAILPIGGMHWRFALTAACTAEVWKFRAYGKWGNDDVILMLDNTIIQQWITTALGNIDFSILPDEIITAATETVLEEALDALEHLSGLPLTVSSILLEEDTADCTPEMLPFTLTYIPPDNTVESNGSYNEHPSGYGNSELHEPSEFAFDVDDNVHTPEHDDLSFAPEENSERNEHNGHSASSFMPAPQHAVPIRSVHDLPQGVPSVIHGALYVSDAEFDESSERTLALSFPITPMDNTTESPLDEEDHTDSPQEPAWSLTHEPPEGLTPARQKYFTPSEALETLLKLLHQYGVPHPEGYISTERVHPLPLRVPVEIAEVRLPLHELFSVDPQDILLLDSFYPSTTERTDTMSVLLRIPNGPVLLGALNGTTITIQEHDMSTDPVTAYESSPHVSSPRNNEDGFSKPVVSHADLSSIELPVRLEIDTLTMSIEQLSTLSAGCLLETSRTTDAAVTLSVNGKAIGTGELVDIAGKIGVRVLTIGINNAHSPQK